MFYFLLILLAFQFFFCSSVPDHLFDEGRFSHLFFSEFQSKSPVTRFGYLECSNGDISVSDAFAPNRRLLDFGSFARRHLDIKDFEDTSTVVIGKIINILNNNSQVLLNRMQQMADSNSATDSLVFNYFRAIQASIGLGNELRNPDVLDVLAESLVLTYLCEYGDGCGSTSQFMFEHSSGSILDNFVVEVSECPIPVSPMVGLSYAPLDMVPNQWGDCNHGDCNYEIHQFSRQYDSSGSESTLAHSFYLFSSEEPQTNRFINSYTYEGDSRRCLKNTVSALGFSFQHDSRSDPDLPVGVDTERYTMYPHFLVSPTKDFASSTPWDNPGMSDGKLYLYSTTAPDVVRINDVHITEGTRHVGIKDHFDIMTHYSYNKRRYLNPSGTLNKEFSFKQFMHVISAQHSYRASGDRDAIPSFAHSMFYRATTYGRIFKENESGWTTSLPLSMVAHSIIKNDLFPGENVAAPIFDYGFNIFAHCKRDLCFDRTDPSIEDRVPEADRLISDFVDAFPESSFDMNCLHNPYTRALAIMPLYCNGRSYGCGPFKDKSENWTPYLFKSKLVRDEFADVLGEMVDVVDDYVNPVAVNHLGMCFRGSCRTDFNPNLASSPDNVFCNMQTLKTEWSRYFAFTNHANIEHVQKTQIPVESFTKTFDTKHFKMKKALALPVIYGKTIDSNSPVFNQYQSWIDFSYELVKGPDGKYSSLYFGQPSVLEPNSHITLNELTPLHTSFGSIPGNYSCHVPEADDFVLCESGGVPSPGTPPGNLFVQRTGSDISGFGVVHGLYESYKCYELIEGVDRYNLRNGICFTTGDTLSITPSSCNSRIMLSRDAFSLYEDCQPMDCIKPYIGRCAVAEKLMTSTNFTIGNNGTCDPNEGAFTVVQSDGLIATYSPSGILCASERAADYGEIDFRIDSRTNEIMDAAREKLENQIKQNNFENEVFKNNTGLQFLDSQKVQDELRESAQKRDERLDAHDGHFYNIFNFFANVFGVAADKIGSLKLADFGWDTTKDFFGSIGASIKAVQDFSENLANGVAKATGDAVKASEEMLKKAFPGSISVECLWFGEVSEFFCGTVFSGFVVLVVVVVVLLIKILDQCGCLNRICCCFYVPEHNIRLERIVSLLLASKFGSDQERDTLALKTHYNMLLSENNFMNEIEDVKREIISRYQKADDKAKAAEEKYHHAAAATGRKGFRKKNLSGKIKDRVTEMTARIGTKKASSKTEVKNVVFSGGS